MGYLPLNAQQKMTDVTPSLLNLHVYDVYEPRTSQRQFSLCPRL